MKPLVSYDCWINSGVHQLICGQFKHTYKLLSFWIRMRVREVFLLCSVIFQSSSKTDLLHMYVATAFFFSHNSNKMLFLHICQTCHYRFKNCISVYVGNTMWLAGSVNTFFLFVVSCLAWSDLSNVIFSSTVPQKLCILLSLNRIPILFPFIPFLRFKIKAAIINILRWRTDDVTTFMWKRVS